VKLAFESGLVNNPFILRLLGGDCAMLAEDIVHPVWQKLLLGDGVFAEVVVN